MIRLNKITDYGVVVLSFLATRRGATVTTAEVAADTGVPVPTVAKILKILARAGIVASLRGAGGGYALARPAAEITIAQIVEALEGPIVLAECVDGSENQCGVEMLCPMRGGWNRISEAIAAALSEVTLLDMITPPDFPLPEGGMPASGADRGREA